MKTAKKDRPRNIEFANVIYYNMPFPTALVSITHRVTGVALFIGAAFLMWLLQLSLSNEAGFQQAEAVMAGGLAKFICWGFFSSLLFHLVVGIKHLLMDMGWGEELESANTARNIALVISVVLIIAAGAWIW